MPPALHDLPDRPAAGDPDPAQASPALTTPAPDQALAVPAALAASTPLTPAAGITTVEPSAAPRDATSSGQQNRAILIMCLVSLVFAWQDALSRHLGERYPTYFVVMLRYWFFAAFVAVMAARAAGGLRAAARTRRPVLQTLRGLLLVAEVSLMQMSFVHLGLVETHALFTAYPLLVVALSGPMLGERVGWRRWLAVGVGFVGILIILQPGLRVFSPWAALPLISSLMFAVYGLLTRLVSRDDPATVSFFWTGIAGAAGITVVGLANATPMALVDWPWMLGLCLTAVLGHYLLIRAYELAEASSLQPFAYTQLVWVSIIGVLLFGERVAPNVVLGAVIVVAAGLFTWWRAQIRARMADPRR
ncbi:DMT family transporter [uncultured Paracoccus sp.]|uniref:DMT family transporter n=1 Tax=uncultured Paracoccus sp. TaxID=189685 RepID=UPI002625B482|nr:DMT family transporter [uncultured Paracoccus sp.]